MPDREASLALDMATSMAEEEYPGGPLLVIGGLPQALRGTLVARAGVLAGSVSAMTKEQQASATGAIMAMLGVFGGAQGGDPRQLVAAKYVEVCADLPLWAVQQACRLLERGEVPDVSLDFRPAAPRLRQVADKLLEPARAELHRLRRVLDAKVVPEPDPETKRRVGELFAELSNSLRMGGKPAAGESEGQ